VPVVTPAVSPAERFPIIGHLQLLARGAHVTEARGKLDARIVHRGVLARRTASVSMWCYPRHRIERASH